MGQSRPFHRSSCASAAPAVVAERITTTSQDECLAWLHAAGLHVTCNQMSPDPYVAEFELVTLSNALRFSHSCYGAAVTTRGAPPRGAYTFSLSNAESGGLYFNQQRLGAGEIGVLRPGQEFFVSRPAGLRSLVVYADAGLVERRCAALHGVGVAAFLRSSTVRARQSAMAACIGQFAQVARRAAAGDMPAQDAEDCVRLSEELMDGVLGAFAPPDGHFGWSGRQRLLDRAWRIVEDDTSVVTVGQLCATLGVPIRTLDDSFKSGLGVSPKRFILALRLNRVRQLLRQADEDTTVTDVATNLSFFHFGHFATHYRSLFGETPSQTLRTARWRRGAAPPSAGRRRQAPAAVRATLSRQEPRIADRRG